MKRLSRDKYTTVLDPTLSPAITIASGEELVQDRHLPGPRALTPQHFAVLASGEDVGQTMRQAVRHTVDFLVQERGMESYAAYSLLSRRGTSACPVRSAPSAPSKCSWRVQCWSR